MLHEVSGDLLLSRAQVIAHGIAPGDHFDSGLALGLRERWPSLYKAFRRHGKVKKVKPGTLWTWTSPEGVRVVNLFTQEPPPSERAHPGPATLQHVNHALKALAKLTADEGFESLALPRLATGVGRLDWSDVRPLIAQHLGALEIPVILYTEFHAGTVAKEPLAAREAGPG